MCFLQTAYLFSRPRRNKLYRESLWGVVVLELKQDPCEAIYRDLKRLGKIGLGCALLGWDGKWMNFWMLEEVEWPNDTVPMEAMWLSI